MSNDELDAVVISLVRHENGRATIAWLEAQVRARFGPEEIYEAPDTFDIQRSVWRLVEACRLSLGPGYKLSVWS